MASNPVLALLRSCSAGVNNWRHLDFSVDKWWLMPELSTALPTAWLFCLAARCCTKLEPAQPAKNTGPVGGQKYKIFWSAFFLKNHNSDHPDKKIWHPKSAA